MSSINVVYSGGVQNTDPNKSLGGFPSPVAVTDQKNNLFDDISSQETTQGRTDYRCIYIFNDTDLRYDINLSIEYLKDLGATVQLGVLLQNAAQSLRFGIIPTGGTFTLTIQGLKSSTITWDDDPTALGEAIQTALETVTDCEVELLSDQFYYRITFKGILANKALTTLSVTDNNLLPYGTIIPTVQTVVIGSPINTIAPDTGFENNAPTGIAFYSAVIPVNIGALNPSEGFPVWVKRTISPGFEAVEGDGFVLHTNVTGTVL